MLPKYHRSEQEMLPWGSAGCTSQGFQNYTHVSGSGQFPGWVSLNVGSQPGGLEWRFSLPPSLLLPGPT